MALQPDSPLPRVRPHRPVAEAIRRPRGALVADLRRAIAQDELHLAWEPVVRLHDGAVDHHQVMPCWDHAERGSLAPETVVALAEETGLMPQLGDWIVDRAMAHLSRSDDPTHPRPRRLALNLSSIQWRTDPACLTRWRDRWAGQGLAPDGLLFDLAEPGMAEHTDLLRPALDHLRLAGLPVTLDDFGSGRASMAQLQRMGFETIRIAPGRLRGIEHDAQVLADGEGLVEQAHQLGLRVVAKGIETAAQRAVLEAIGCDMGQGRLFAGSAFDGSDRTTRLNARTLHA